MVGTLTAMLMRTPLRSGSRSRHGPARETGGAVRRCLSPHRLCAVESGKRRLRTDLRTDAIQVALPRPAHLADLVEFGLSWRVHHAGAGAAAARAALVHRQRRRHIPVDESDHRREARVHRGFRCRSRVPDGPRADGAGTYPQRRRRHGRRDPGAPFGGVRVRVYRRRRVGEDHQVPGEAQGPARHPRRPGRHVRLDGQLRVHHRGAGVGAAGRRRRLRLRYCRDRSRR